MPPLGQYRGMKIKVVFYSMYGHVYQLAEEVAAGAREVEGAEVTLHQVAELVPEEALVKMGAKAARETFAHVPVIAAPELAEADALIFGTPTRFGNMAAQMRNLLDQTGGLWARAALAGKVSSVFTSSASQHFGQETTITSFWHTLAHHGMIIVPLSPACGELFTMTEIIGGGPYGAATLTGSDGKRPISDIERRIARFQGRHVAGITKKMVG